MRAKTQIKKGDLVMVISGGHKEKRPIKGKVGRVLGFVGDKGDRVIVEGLNLFVRHKRAQGPDRSSEIVRKEGSIHISNVMFYAEKIKKPVRIKHALLADGKKVRGYTDPESKEFVQIDV